MCDISWDNGLAFSQEEIMLCSYDQVSNLGSNNFHET